VNEVALLNGRFHSVTMKQTIEHIFSTVHSGQRGYLCTVNVAILMMMREDPRLQAFVDHATLRVADGQPIVWASRAQGNALPERVTGVDLVELVCERAANEGVGIYLLGATRDVIGEVARRLKQRYPQLTISGTDDGYFNAEQAPQRANAIAQSGAKILIVGMGVPRQEHFIEEQWDRLGVAYALPVGGSFDVIAGLRSRAPELVQKVGMEWAYRLAQEPRRLFKRYLTTNSQFLGLMARDMLRRRVQGGGT
jgi:N-acetylglucosaminyldiphosphoundecaprenol N-acetyl-beta-D-mannosaminyltransferase